MELKDYFNYENEATNKQSSYVRARVSTILITTSLWLWLGAYPKTAVFGSAPNPLAGTLVPQNTDTTYNWKGTRVHIRATPRASIILSKRSLWRELGACPKTAVLWLRTYVLVLVLTYSPEYSLPQHNKLAVFWTAVGSTRGVRNTSTSTVIRTQITAVFGHAPNQLHRDDVLRIVLTLVRTYDVCVR
jgi:hypothetical protein